MSPCHVLSPYRSQDFPTACTYIRSLPLTTDLQYTILLLLIQSHSITNSRVYIFTFIPAYYDQSFIACFFKPEPESAEPRPEG